MIFIESVFEKAKTVFFVALLVVLMILLSVPALIQELALRVKYGHYESKCVKCGSNNVIARGFKGHNRRYECKDCGHTFNPG